MPCDTKSAVLLLGVTIAYVAILRSTTAENKAGKACINNSTCGPNELCQTVTWLDSPCDAAICLCKPGFVSGGLAFPYQECSEFKGLKLGDTCTMGAFNEKILIPYAECQNGKVDCLYGFEKFGSGCVKHGGQRLPFGSICDSNVYGDCDGVLSCVGMRCKCGSSFQKYDSAQDVCINRELGDSCTGTEGCLLAGVYYGYLSLSEDQSGACINYKCECNAYTRKKVTLTYFDDLTGAKRTQDICVRKDTTIANVGEECLLPSLQPRSDSAAITICNDGLVCTPCSPITNSTIKGKCMKPRSATKGNPINVPYQAYPAPTPAPGYSTAANPEPALDKLYQALPIDPKLAMDDIEQDIRTAGTVLGLGYYPMSAKNLRQCSSTVKCRLNEECVKPSQCSRGYCWCKPGYYYPVDNADCELKIDATSTSTTTISTTTYETTTSTSTTTRTVKSREYNSSCSSHDECQLVAINPIGVWRNNKLMCRAVDGNLYCLCKGDNFIWRNQQCEPRDYSDPCTDDSHCNHGLYTFSTGYKCASQMCGCADDYIPVQAAILQAIWGSTIPSYVTKPDLNRTYCVLKTQTNTVVNGSNCTLGVLSKSAGPTIICPSGQVCLGCPLDYRQDPAIGTCTTIAFPSSDDGSSSTRNAAASKEATNSLFCISFVTFSTYLISVFLPNPKYFDPLPHFYSPR